MFNKANSEATPISIEELYFSQIRYEYENIDEQQKKNHTEAASYIDSVINDVNTGDKITLCKIFSMERALLKLLPIEKLKSESFIIIEKYKHATFSTQKDFDRLLAIDNIDENSLRANMETVLKELHRKYVFYPTLEIMQRNVIRKSVSIALIMVAIMTLLISLQCSIKAYSFSDLVFIVIIGMSGAVGAYVSLQQRIKNMHNDIDPLDNYLELKYGQSSYFISPLAGSLFAILLFFVFKTEIFQSDVFPKFPDMKSTHTDVIDFFTNLAVIGNKDFAKTLVWSFLSGFAERLVPDTLDKLVAKKQKATQV